MSIIEIKIPSPGESITNVELAAWLVNDGDVVSKDTELAEVESDKATLTILAEEGGKVSLKAEVGDTLDVGAVACTIDTSVQPKEDSTPKEAPKEVEKTTDKKDEKPAESSSKEAKTTAKKPSSTNVSDANKDVKITPLAQKMMTLEGLSVDDVIKGLKRIKREHVEAISGLEESTQSSFKKAETRETDANKMSSLRRKLSERLVSVKNETAMLTTFNEVDMSAIMAMRKKYQPKFVEKHGLKLGFMSFFIKACGQALQQFPNVNAMIDNQDIVTHKYVDISVAVSTPKGLMVPVIRNVQSLGLADIEHEVKNLAEKARKGKLSIPEMTGGTFTVTNGGIFGSMLSTPIINPPQSAILGMHNILERPMAVNGEVVIKPMMYVALSYDHRIIDGKTSVSFLVEVKRLLENPEQMLWNGTPGEEVLLEL